MDIEAFKNIEIALPTKPGVYRYYDKDNNILYVGKAKHLKKRTTRNTCVEIGTRSRNPIQSSLIYAEHHVKINKTFS